MNELHFTTTINASKERVWSTLWSDETFRQWAGLIDPGTYMTGELRQGNEVQFISAENGYGVTSLVDECREYKFVRLKHQADTQDVGERSRDDQWTGGAETYELDDSHGVTTLTTTFDVPAELEELFRKLYPKALAKVKDLAERTA